MRERSGNWSALEYIALDFETTGLDPAVDEVISMGAILITSGRIDLSRSVYGETFHDRPANRSGVTVHGLRPRDLRGSRPREDLEARLDQAIAGRQILAWAAWVEAAFLGSIYGDAGRTWRLRIIDVRDLVTHLDRVSGVETPDAESLVSCSARLGVPPSQAHHAYGDALMTAELFLVLAHRLDRIGLGRGRDLHRLGSGRRKT